MFIYSWMKLKFRLSKKFYDWQFKWCIANTAREVCRGFPSKSIAKNVFIVSIQSCIENTISIEELPNNF